MAVTFIGFPRSSVMTWPSASRMHTHARLGSSLATFCADPEPACGQGEVAWNGIGTSWDGSLIGAAAGGAAGGGMTLTAADAPADAGVSVELDCMPIMAAVTPIVTTATALRNPI